MNKACNELKTELYRRFDEFWPGFMSLDFT